MVGVLIVAVVTGGLNVTVIVSFVPPETGSGGLTLNVLGEPPVSEMVLTVPIADGTAMVSETESIVAVTSVLGTPAVIDKSSVPPGATGFAELVTVTLSIGGWDAKDRAAVADRLHLGIGPRSSG